MDRKLIMLFQFKSTCRAQNTEKIKKKLTHLQIPPCRFNCCFNLRIYTEKIKTHLQIPPCQSRHLRRRHRVQILLQSGGGGAHLNIHSFLFFFSICDFPWWWWWWWRVNAMQLWYLKETGIINFFVTKLIYYLPFFYFDIFISYIKVLRYLISKS